MRISKSELKIQYSYVMSNYIKGYKNYEQEKKWSKSSQNNEYTSKGYKMQEPWLDL